MTHSGSIIAAAQSPGKLILSGEHAAVYGQPALALATSHHARATITERQQDIMIRVGGSEYTRRFSPADLHALASQVQGRYDAFCAGTIPIERVLDEPFDLLLMAMHAGLGNTTAAFQLELELTIPLGCGMGSSAAAGLAIIAAVARAAGHQQSRDDLYESAMQVESYQHGRPSGVDTTVCLHGGLIRFQKGQSHQPVTFEAAILADCHLILTGRPAASTGECVSYVRQHHGESTIWPAFGNVTEAIQTAFCTNHATAFRDAVRENHQLLTQIGVVPATVQQFVQQVENAGGAAKVCGAGSTKGESAGVLLVTGLSTQILQDLLVDYPYILSDLQWDSHGTRLL